MTTTETERSSTPRSIAARTGAFVASRIGQLQEQFVRQPYPTSYSRAALARLRRGLGKEVGQVPDLMEFTIDPEAPTPPGDAPTSSETAAHTAFTLYALHQQSQSRRMHDPRRTFAQAVGSIRFQDGDENAGVLRRFQALATAASMEEFTQHTRGLITLLRSADRGFDYGRLAADLVRFQNPAQADAIRLAWGRDFYRIKSSTGSSEESS